ncbi:MAG TPA: hypothetical protein P5286_01820 [Treponemataceae bacterium]|nr:hypothetical protein [Treponemataceae bacterium]
METFNTLSEMIRNHIKQIAKTSGLPEGDETLEALAAAWVEKKQCFEDGVSENNLDEVDFFAKDTDKGALALTYSGSLITIGPLVDGARHAEYTSIGLRTDVPGSAVEENAILSSDIEKDSVVMFEKGPIQQSSPIFKIAVSNEDLEAEEEEALLTQVTQDITEEFVEVNKTIIQ